MAEHATAVRDDGRTQHRQSDAEHGAVVQLARLQFGRIRRARRALTRGPDRRTRPEPTFAGSVQLINAGWQVDDHQLRLILLAAEFADGAEWAVAGYATAVPPFSHTGRTAVEELELRCAPCHQFRHRNLAASRRTAGFARLLSVAETSRRR